MQLVTKKLSEIKPYKNNPRKNDMAVDDVAESIRQCDYNAPIVVDENNVILAGHTRMRALQKLGYDEAEVIVKEGLTEKQKKKYRLLDNQTSSKSEWDYDKLMQELDGMDFEGFDFGFDVDMEDEADAEAVEDDYDEEPPAEPKSKIGDIYKLGRHRLMCADSTKAEDVARLMDGQKADMVFTDPPYGCGFESKGVNNDNQNQNDLLEFNKKWIPLSFEFTKENGSWYCWGIDESLMRIYAFILLPYIEKKEITFRNLLTWDKGLGQNQNDENMRSYAAADEKCLFVMCGVQGFNNNADNYFEGYEPVRSWLKEQAKKANIDAKKVKEICGVGMFSHWFTKSQWDLMTEENYQKLQTYCVKNNINAFRVEYGTIKEEYEKIKEEYEKIKEEWYSTRAYFDNTHDNMNNVWHFSRTSAEERKQTGGHATPKPIALCCRAIKTSSREGETVLDLFGGSGSTLIACEQLDRTCYMMELSPQYIDVIIDRWEKFTGQKAVKIS